ncbi:MAG: aminotransferase class IV [Clostridia bacterium]|nr:aminotransferase class IV [Clostridia bacterium]
MPRFENLGYFNGTYGPLDELVVPFNDRVHFFGDGIYDATYTHNHVIYALDEHIDRFFSSAALIDIHIKQTKEEIAALLNDLVQKVETGDQLVYFQATRGTQIRKHLYDDDLVANFWVVLKPMKVKDVYETVSCATLPDNRYYMCNVKTLNLLPAVLYAKQAQKLGVYETILYREGGRVTECYHSNVSIIRTDGVFQTAPTDNLILPGISRAHLIRACRELSIPVEEKPFSLDEMRAAAEIVLSSSGAFCSGVDTLDGVPVGGKAPELLNQLREWTLADWHRQTGA